MIKITKKDYIKAFLKKVFLKKKKRGQYCRERYENISEDKKQKLI